MRLQRKLFFKSPEEVAENFRKVERRKLAKEYLDVRRAADSQALENYSRNMKTAVGKSGENFKFDFDFKKRKPKSNYVSRRVESLSTVIDTTKKGSSEEELRKALKDITSNIKNPSKYELKSSRDNINDATKKVKQLRTDRLAKVKELKAIKAKKVRNAKIGAGIAAGTAALGTGAYLYNKNKKKKKKED